MPHDWWPGRNLDRWPAVEDYWPRRLLHIPTMTSHTRSGKATYLQTEYPRYSILSYTWGRWQLSDPTKGPALAVAGTTWPVPAVDPAHFTVEQFRRVVQLMADHGSDWAWIDIACIDQEAAAVKMDEVGRQASIFKNASRAYVWLSHLPHATLQACYASMTEAALDTITLAHGAARGGPQEPLLSALRVIENAVEALLEDPWFSSLWTLQEIMMRDDALIITKEGQEAVATLKDIEPHRLFIEVLMNNLGNIMHQMWNFKHIVLEDGYDCDTRVLEVITTIRDRLYQSGLTSAMMARDPNLQYGMARFRRTQHREDRIYGIMQIYNLRVGQAVRPGDTPSLEELVVEFGLAINVQSPLRGQLFVHTAAPRPGLSWCITEESAVPQLLGLGANARVMTRISAAAAAGDNAGLVNVNAVGYMCAFQPFYWANMAVAPLVQMELFFDHEILQEMPLDSGIFREVGFSHDPTLWQQQGEQLLGRLGPDALSVWILGDSEDGRLKAPFRAHYGVLLRETGDGSEAEAVSYERIGVCVWSMARGTDDLLLDDGGDQDYTELKGRLKYLEDGNQQVDIPALSKHTRSITELFSGPLTIDFI